VGADGIPAPVEAQGVDARHDDGAQDAYDRTMTPVSPPNDEALRRLVDDYRGRCLWFLRQGYYPETTEEALRVLDSIQRYGDVEAFRRAGELKRWVLAPSSAASATS
jgi:hypothetical protein